MPDYDPRAELAPRDVVSLSIVSQMEKTRHPNVYLDMTHLDPQRVLSRFPGIAAICAEFDLDITRDRIPVRPGAHYMMGGITVDLRRPHDLARSLGRRRSHLHRAARGQSPGLEQSSGSPGLRGPCRRRGVVRAALGLKDDFFALPIENPRVDSIGEPLNLDDIRNALKSLMWRNVGVRRDGEGLAEARQTVKHWCRYVLARQFNDPGGWELQNMICIARLDDRGRPGARGEPRRPRPHRLSRGGRSPLESAYLFSAPLRGHPLSIRIVLASSTVGVLGRFWVASS